MLKFAGVVLAVMGAMLVGCSGNGDKDHSSHDHDSGMSEHQDAGHDSAHQGSGMADRHSSGAVTDEQMNATCPVMGDEQTDPEIFTVYNGRKVYFCCDQCIDRFKQSPEHYFAKAYPNASGR